ncbi:MAG: hypothetical protein QOD03_1219 [Verrucomicrobiota bacterium]
MNCELFSIVWFNVAMKYLNSQKLILISFAQCAVSQVSADGGGLCFTSSGIFAWGRLSSSTSIE